MEAQETSKIAVIIGGSSDIGIGIIQELLLRNYIIYATYNNTQPRINDTRIIWMNVNLTESEEIYKFVNDIKRNVNQINVLIYNASLILRKSFLELADTEIIDIFNINVFSAYIMIREFYSIFSNNAKIIVTGSHMGIVPHSVSPIYGMSKSALHAMVKNLVKVFDGTQITINAIVPGFVETKLQKDKPKEIRHSIYNKTQLHRFANVDEIVQGYLFCIDNDFISGSLIEINGGYNYK